MPYHSQNVIIYMWGTPELCHLFFFIAFDSWARKWIGVICIALFAKCLLLVMFWVSLKPLG